MCVVTRDVKNILFQTFAQPPPPPGLYCPEDDTITTCDCRPEYIQCHNDSQCPGGKTMIHHTTHTYRTDKLIELTNL